MLTIAVVGGGAAGFFGAITAKASNPKASVTIYEKSNQLLSKVRVSGGGRCNVTTSIQNPKELVKNYPRGGKELLGPFHTFGPKQTVEWFQKRGVRLKTEPDGRMFPISDSSQEIISCLMGEAKRLGVDISTQSRVDQDLKADRILLATGSHRSGYEWAQACGHTIEKPVPSLFTFNIPHFDLIDLAGVAVPSATISIVGTRLFQQGPLLITHWGFSGPAALKLSAWGARHLFEADYKADLQINWISKPFEKARSELEGYIAWSQPLFGLPKSLWRKLLDRAGSKSPYRIATILTQDRYTVEGKTTHKAEFVTCGGVRLSEVNFKTMESRLSPHLYFAGEILDIDGVTGGFNFQNAWTTGFLAGRAMATAPIATDL